MRRLKLFYGYVLASSIGHFAQRSHLLLKDRRQVLEQTGVLRRCGRCHHDGFVLGTFEQ